MADNNIGSEGFRVEPDWESMSHMQRNFYLVKTGIVNPPKPEPNVFKPTLFFFYGTLTIPAILKQILQLTEEPVLLKAQTSMYKVKMWGPYPALVDLSPDDNDEREPVKGVAYTVETEEHFKRLVAYEGGNYTPAMALIKILEPGYEMEDVACGKTFIWQGYSEELQDGAFDPTGFKDYFQNEETSGNDTKETS
ncbi:hypothetical protein TWF481_001891 [Arthrobotrys musiformis]|uniref:Gamma-glutamylcyclotransferase AIG2-like domain-containing protein n=1 Tax=Arthrobotrys musiformis TaxID=47236 RepID=A0AAV9VUL8_9PEZI